MRLRDSETNHEVLQEVKGSKDFSALTKELVFEGQYNTDQALNIVRIGRVE